MIILIVGIHIQIQVQVSWLGRIIIELELDQLPFNQQKQIDINNLLNNRKLLVKHRQIFDF